MFDPGISQVCCQNFLVSKYSNMEEDCQDTDTVISVPTKHEDPPDLNKFLSST